MPHLRPMTVADIPLGMRLVTQAKWNQRPRDWERFLAMQPEGCFVAEVDREPVGTTVACLFGDVAWIAMVLVEEQRRGQGIGTALVRRALEFVDAQGARSVRLDATAFGQPLYEKLGFVAQYELTRFAGRLPQAAGDASCLSRLAEPADCARLWAYDHAITHTDRRKLLSRLGAEDPTRVTLVEQDGRLRGWMTVRPGREAWQLGPCLADQQAGEWLLDDAARRLSGELVLFDAPCANTPALRWAEALGLVATRRFVRMCRGEPVVEDTSRLWGSSGPELG